MVYLVYTKTPLLACSSLLQTVLGEKTIKGSEEPNGEGEQLAWIPMTYSQLGHFHAVASRKQPVSTAKPWSSSIELKRQAYNTYSTLQSDCEHIIVLFFIHDAATLITCMWTTTFSAEWETWRLCNSMTLTWSQITATEGNWVDMNFVARNWICGGV